jgi:hypothetical protein
MSGDALKSYRGSLSPRARGGSGVIAAAGVLIWLIASPGRPAARVAGASGQIASNPTTVVCVGADGVLRVSGTGGTCGGGQTAMPVSTGATNCDDCDPWNPKDDPNPGPSSPTDKLGALESKVAALEKGPLFEVADENGRPVFDVWPGEVVLRNRAGAPVATLHATETGGYLTAHSAAGQLASSIGVSGNVGGVLITEGGLKRVEFGKQPAGNISLRVLGSAGPVAAIGESQAGTGALVVGDYAGGLRALMSVVDGKGSVSTRNANGAPVVALTEGATAGGLLVVGDAGSEPMVKFGVNEDRYGIVLAGPVAGAPLVPATGLPGSYILGCAAGERCGPGGGGRRWR